jgi:threonine dehydrogenase-like Zn-dependent dehydrogenase
MRALQLIGESACTVVTVGRPQPAAHQVRIRLEGSGVCASNRPVWEGRPWFTYPLAPGAPGHEGWGVVDEVGPGVGDDLLGRRVTFLSDRAYAEWDVTDAAHIVAIPPELDGQPCPGEPLACAVNVIRRSAITPGSIVVVVGMGFLGLLLVRLATLQGASIIAVSRRESALALARAAGARETLCVAEGVNVVEQVRERTAGRLASCVIETGGYQSTLDLATELTAERGRLVIAGYHQDGSRLVNLQLWNWRGLDVINAHERDPLVYVDGMRAGLDLVRSGALSLAPLISHELDLDHAGEAFRLLAERPDGFVKASIRLGSP